MVKNIYWSHLKRLYCLLYLSYLESRRKAMIKDYGRNKYAEEQDPNQPKAEEGVSFPAGNNPTGTRFPLFKNRSDEQSTDAQASYPIKDYGRDSKKAIPSDLAEEFKGNEQNSEGEYIFPHMKLLMESIEPLRKFVDSHPEENGFVSASDMKEIEEVYNTLNAIWVRIHGKIVGEKWWNRPLD